MPPLVLLTRSLNYGGSERQLIMLATGLKASGVPVRVATFYDGGSKNAQCLASRHLQARVRESCIV